jgi:hypothetical protein
VSPPLWQFNPAEPAGNSEFSGGALIDGRIGPCGACQSCPTYWRLTCTTSGDLAAPYAGTQILQRRRPEPPQLDARCVWLSRPADPDALPTLSTPYQFSLWRLAWGAWPDPYSGPVSPTEPWWATRWSLAAGAYYWPLATSTEPRLVTGASLLPGTALGYAGWTPGDLYHCLAQNSMTRVETLDPGFPVTITLEPYWP